MMCFFIHYIYFFVDLETLCWTSCHYIALISTCMYVWYSSPTIFYKNCIQLGLILTAVKKFKKKLSFFCSCVNSAALPLVHCYSIRPPRRVASWVNYSSRQTETSSEHFASDLSLLKADVPWCENKRCSGSNPWPMDPKASVLSTTPQRPTNM